VKSVKSVISYLHYFTSYARAPFREFSGREEEEKDKLIEIQNH
jgi:hypothetical protein